MENKINYYSEDKEQFADVYIKKDLIFKCRVNGLNNFGSTVILLHGFPETSKMWSKLIKILDYTLFTTTIHSTKNKKI